MSAFLTVVVLLSQQHVYFAATLDHKFKNIEECAAQRDAVVKEWAAGTPFPYRLRFATCSIGSELKGGDHPAPKHLRDIKLPVPDSEI